MKYVITRWEAVNMLEKTGDDIAFFNIFIAVNGEQELPIPITIFFEKLMSHIHNSAIEEYNYINKIGNDLRGYGPKHSKIIKVLNEEEYNFSPHIESYITSEKIEMHIEWVQRINSNSKENKEKLNEFLDILDNDSYKDNNIRYTAFLDDIDDTLHQLTMKHYPELFEKDSSIIELYKHELITATMNFAQAMDKLTSTK